MPNFTPNVDAAYREYAKEQFRRHLLLIEGKGESEEVDEIEQRLSVLWDGLDETQRRSLNGMASDLNWLRRRGTPPPNGRPASEITDAQFQELQAAQDAGDWHAILHHLRVCAAAVPKDLLAYSRATCYHQLDFPQISAAFADLTVELSRGTGPVARSAFDVLRHLTPELAFRRANEVMSSASVYPSVLVAQSIAYVFDTLGADPALFDAGKLVGMLQDARRRLDSNQTSAADRMHFCQLAGAALQAFGQVLEARELYEEGLLLDPENPDLLAGLGLSLYDTNTLGAVELFKKAILVKATFMRPYIHLAHYHLVRREFASAFEYAKQAMDLAREDRARAAILEIMAISADELGHPAKVVMQMFSEAARLAPNSLRIAANLNAFAQSLDNRKSKAEWDCQEDSADYAVREPIEMASKKDAAFARGVYGAQFPVRVAGTANLIPVGASGLASSGSERG